MIPWKYYIINCEDGVVTGTNDIEVAKWYSNGDYTLVINAASGNVLYGNEELTEFEESVVMQAEIPDEGDEE